MHLPQRPADFTSEWLTHALQAGGAPETLKVSSLTITPMGLSTGLTSDIFQIVPVYEDGPAGPTAINVKLCSEDEVTMALGTSLRLFDREIHFYRELAGEAGVTVPAVYFADTEEDTGRYVLLLEDVGRVADQNPLHDCTVAEAEKVIAALARMHAKWWQSERLKSLTWLAAGTSRNFNFAIQRKYQQAWPGFFERYGEKLPRGLAEIGEALVTRVSRFHERASVPPVTLTHGTLQPQNIYFRNGTVSPAQPAPGQEAGDVMLISWQTVALRPGPWDLAYFLAIGLPVEERRTHEMRLLRRYHDRLLDHGVKDYSFDKVVAEYRNGLTRMLIITAISEDNLDLSTPAGHGYVERHIERSVALRDWKCGDYQPL